MLVRLRNQRQRASGREGRPVGQIFDQEKHPPTPVSQKLQRNREQLDRRRREKLSSLITWRRMRKIQIIRSRRLIILVDRAELGKLLKDWICRISKEMYYVYWIVVIDFRPCWFMELSAWNMWFIARLSIMWQNCSDICTTLHLYFVRLNI